MIAGLEEPTSGDMLIGGRVVNDLTPARTGHRDGLPELRAVPAPDGLRQHRLSAQGPGRSPKAEHARQGRAGRPRSSGSRASSSASPGSSPAASASAWPSRGRSCASPQVFLLDEPLSNLDAKLRASAREELQKFQKEIGTTAIYVTHDQVEAMAMGDRVVIMDHGTRAADRHAGRGLRRPGGHVRRDVPGLAADEPARDGTGSSWAFARSTSARPTAPRPRRRGALPLPVRADRVPGLRAPGLRHGSRATSAGGEVVWRFPSWEAGAGRRRGPRRRRGDGAAALLRRRDRPLRAPRTRLSGGPRRRWLGPALLAPAVLYIAALVGFPVLLAIFLARQRRARGKRRRSTSSGFAQLRRRARDPGVPGRAAQLVPLHAGLADPRDRRRDAPRPGAEGGLPRPAASSAFLVLLPWVAPISLGAIGWKWLLDSLYSVVNWMLARRAPGRSRRTRRCGWASRASRCSR